MNWNDDGVLDEIIDPSGGTVAVTWKGHTEPGRLECSGGKAEELVDETDFACHVRMAQDAVAAADHAHDLETPDGDGGGFHRLEAACRADDTLERAMISLKDVIQIFRRPMLDILAAAPRLVIVGWPSGKIPVCQL
jgi:hypothetical protein